MAKEKKHKRFIKCTQKVTYYQEVELNDKELAILEKEDGGCGISIRDEKPYHLLESIINHSEVFDAEQEYNDFELLKK